MLNVVAGGFEVGDRWFRQLVEGALALVGGTSAPVPVAVAGGGGGAAGSTPAAAAAAAVELLLVLASGCENVAANSLLEYLHREDAFDALVLRFPARADVAAAAVFSALLVAVLIANYQKYETRNLFVARFADLPEAAVALLARPVVAALARASAALRLPDAVASPADKVSEKRVFLCCLTLFFWE